jgi:hypothetical protein
LQLICWCLAYVNTATANNVYIAQSASGANNGTSAADAYAVSYFNSEGNWTSSPTGTRIGPGTMVHLVGTISTPLTVQGSGAAGNVVSILFEPGAAMSAPQFPNGAIINNGCNYIVIDGGSNGKIVATNSNSSTHKWSDGVILYGSSCEVKRLAITNMYVRTSSTDTSDGGFGVSVTGSNNSVHDNVISQVETGISVNFPTGGSYGNLLVFNNIISGTNWGVGGGSGGPGSAMDNVQIFGNDITGSDTLWDEPGDTFHHNGIYIYAEQSNARITNLRIYGNYIHGGWGVNNTAYIFISDGASPGGIANALLYNNVIYSTTGGDNDGCILAWVSGARVYNNTLISSSQKGSDIGVRFLSDSSSTAPGFLQNNIMVNFSDPIHYSGGGEYGSVSVTSSNNLINKNPLFVAVDSDFHLTGLSSAIGAGVNLSAYFTTDKEDKKRPAASAAWSIGAYEGSPLVRPPAPKNLRVSPN